MTTKEMLKALEDYVPLFQTLIWSSIILIVVILLRKQLRTFLEAIEERIRKGSPFKVGGVELGQQKMTTKTADLRSEKVEIFGDPDNFQLLFKAESKDKTWTKGTKAMEVPGGCVVQVTTERKNPDGSWSNAEALTFVPGVIIIDDDDGSGRHLGMSGHSSETKAS